MIGRVAVAFFVLGVAGFAFGHAAVGVVAAVGGIAVAAAVSDVRTRRISNGLVCGAGGCVAIVGAALVVVVDGRSVAEVVESSALGVLMSGALVLVGLWAVRPSSIGGGDVKLLVLLASAVGLIGPIAASLIVPVAATFALVQAVVTRCRRVPLGPGLALGYAAAGTIALAANRFIGGWF